MIKNQMEKKLANSRATGFYGLYRIILKMNPKMRVYTGMYPVDNPSATSSKPGLGSETLCPNLGFRASAG